MGYANPDFAIMLSDRKVTCVGDLGSYEEKKLIDIPGYGWFSGAGHGHFLNDFKNILRISKSLNTVERMVDCFGFVGKKYLNQDAENKALIQNTVGMLAAMSLEHADQIDAEKPEPFGRIIVLSYFDGIPRHWYIEHNRIQILYPCDVLNKPEFVKDLEEKYHVDCVEGNIQEIIIHMLKLAREIAAASEYVSSVCDIGVVRREADGWNHYEDLCNLINLPEAI